MALNRRLWRVMRGMSRSVGASLRRPDRAHRDAREEVEQACAEMEARAEIEARALNGGTPPPVATPRELRLPETPTVDGRSPEGTPTLDLGAHAKSPPPGLAALASHYAALGLPPTANLEQVGRAYRRLKERCNPEQFPDDPIQQARARQEEARLDEAYLTLCKALARERRL